MKRVYRRTERPALRSNHSDRIEVNNPVQSLIFFSLVAAQLLLFRRLLLSLMQSFCCYCCRISRSTCHMFQFMSVPFEMVWSQLSL